MVLCEYERGLGLRHPETGRPLDESVVCTVATESRPAVRTMFEVSTLVLFVGPISLISVLYVIMGIKLKVTSPEGHVGRRFTSAGFIQRRARTAAERRKHKSRSNVIRMLGTSYRIHHHHHH